MTDVEQEASEEELRDIDQARGWLRERRRVQSELTSRINSLIQTHSCSAENPLPAYTPEVKRQIVVNLLETALGWCEDDAEFETCLADAKKRAKGGKLVLNDVLKRSLHERGGQNA